MGTFTRGLLDSKTTQVFWGRSPQILTCPGTLIYDCFGQICTTHAPIHPIATTTGTTNNSENTISECRKITCQNVSPGAVRYTCHRQSIYLIEKITGSPSISLKMGRNSCIFQARAPYGIFCAPVHIQVYNSNFLKNYVTCVTNPWNL